MDLSYTVYTLLHRPALNSLHGPVLHILQTPRPALHNYSDQSYTVSTPLHRPALHSLHGLWTAGLLKWARNKWFVCLFTPLGHFYKKKNKTGDISPWERQVCDSPTRFYKYIFLVFLHIPTQPVESRHGHTAFHCL